jgi:Glycosyltransferase family 87
VPALVMLWGLALAHTIILLAKSGERTWHHDFSVFYTSAIALRQNLDPYTVNLVPLGNRLGMKIWPLIHTTDTPLALMLFMPFARMGPATAHAVWIAVNCAALFASLIVLIRPKYSGLEVRMAYAVGAIALLYAPVTENLLFSQRQAIILLLLVLMMRALQSGREAIAGSLLALAIAYRVFPILIAGYFLVRRQWRPLIYAGIGLVLLGLLTIAVMGLPLCLNFVRGVQLALSATSDPAVVSVRATIIRWFSYAFDDRPDRGIEIAQYIAIAFAQLVILALTVMPTMRAARTPGCDLRSFCLWVAATVVLSPLSWIHYMVLLLIPLVSIASAATRQCCSRRALQAAIASYLLIAATTRMRVNVVSETWWQHGLRYFAEGSAVALLLGFLATYWYATDAPNAGPTEAFNDSPRTFATLNACE